MDGQVLQVLVPDVRPSRWETVFLFLTGALASTVLLKIASVQYLELLYLGQLGLLIAAFCARNYRVTWFRPFLVMGLFWAAFCAATLALGVASLRLHFYVPEETSPLNVPVVITIARLLELVANVGIMLYLADRFRKNAQKTRFTMRVFFWTGVASAIYSVLSYPIDLLGNSSYGSYSNPHRFRGFYNEGGPYGLYLMSVFLIGVALYRQKWEPLRRIQWTFVLLAIVFLKSYSKAAIFAIALMVLLNALFASSLTKRLIVVVVGAASLVVIAQVIPFTQLLRAYQVASTGYERLSHQHVNDPSFIYGRVAGAFIAPRMLAAHPWAGVGWGNYGILRNAPEYRGAAAWADLSDTSGLGFAGYAPELGLPLFAFTFVCLLLPFAYLRRIGAPLYVQNMALLQPAVHIAGAQFNLTYPWVTTCFALGLGAWQFRQRKLTALANPEEIT